MATVLRDLQITSTDLVDSPANPEARIQLFKREGDEPSQETLLQKAISALCAVFGRNAADDVEKGAATDNGQAEREEASKSEAEKAVFNGLIAKYAQEQECPHPSAVPDGRQEEQKTADIKKSAKKEETNTMNIDKSKLTPEELAALEAIEKKYGTAETGENADSAPNAPDADNTDVGKGAEPPSLHPDVKKALEANQELATQVEALRKSLEIKDLAIAAGKYEVIGKNAEELAPKLYELKKAGGTVYDEFVALLDEQVTLVEKSGLFGEIGSSRGGAVGNTGELAAKAAEISKNNSGMTEPEALAKAFEENPELAAKYEHEYLKGRAV